MSVCLFYYCVFMCFFLFLAFHVWALLPEIKLIDNNIVELLFNYFANRAINTQNTFGESN